MVNSGTSMHSKILNIDLCRFSILIACVATVALKNWNYIVYAAQAFMILMILGKCMRHGSIPQIGVYVGCYGFFVLWCLLSVFWSASPDRALAAIIGVVQFVVLGLCVVIYILLEHDTEFLISCLAWSGIALLLVLVAVTPINGWSAALEATTDAASDPNRLGTTVGYNSNALGHVCAVCSILCFYEHKIKKPKKLFLVASLVFLFVIFFTKSRLSVVLILALFVVYGLLTSRNFLRRAVMIFVLAAGVAFVFWAMFSIPWLYQLIGFRFVAMLGLSGSVDASTTMRATMIRIGMELFKQHPLTGVGFANFAVHFYYDYGGWKMTYAHSNYVEMLADLGLPGAIAYYAVPVWTLISLLRYRRQARNPELHALLLAALICLLAADYSSISYTNDFTQLLWATSFAYTLDLKRAVSMDAFSSNNSPNLLRPVRSLER